jgi:hypothetical protein
MSHFALVKNGIVQDVIVAEQDFIDANPSEDGVWVQASYNTRGGVHYIPNSQVPSEDQSKALRKNYPGVGYLYDGVRDAFYEPSPYPSWLLDEETCYWEPPIPLPAPPSDEGFYRWNEDETNWVFVPMSATS